MMVWQGIATKDQMALCTDKGRIFLLLINLEIQCTTLITRGRYVAPFRSAARSHRDLHGLRVNSIDRRYVVAVHTADSRMRAAFMPERPRRQAPAPASDNGPIGNSHKCWKSRIKIDARLWLNGQQLVTNVTVL
jgi:hypothetical protein